MSHSIRTLFVFLLLLTSLYAGEYPKTFASLGTPLYKASSQLSHFSNMPLIQKEIVSFQRKSKALKEQGFSVDKSEIKVEKLAYLKALRELQKEYDYLIHLLHREIIKAIEDDDYEDFIKLTSYNLETLLGPNSLRERAIRYYKKHKDKKKSKLLEHFIQEKELLNATSQEFFNQTKSSRFSSQKESYSTYKDVYATTKKYKKYVDIFFTNTNFYDVTIKVKSQYKNIQESCYKDSVFVIKAKSKMRYARLYYRAANARYSFQYNWIIGSKDVRPDKKYLYRLPFRVGESHMVSQGFHGKSTHKGHSEYAVDFKMDIGTKIYAARGGIVVKTKDDSNKKGFSKAFAKYGNYVIVLHDDGTFGTYYHLKKGGVLVSVGERVDRGSALGYSGNTGYTNGPHLHFAVFKAVRTLKTESLPIKFISAQGVVDKPITGKYYKAK
ncbi:M23 family metallopeptidase [Sulfurimonas indica]|uniref:M23 family metallopeptidase n=1 Tax=Sulfurimonas indica TaxID=2508707 RepID=UPI0012649F97|nr:M23 family metallopeptidase [Sulfurimonas indica]